MTRHALVNSDIAAQINSGSWIRRMFEAGGVLKQQYGEDAVCDFSIGNPDLPAPGTVKTALMAVVGKAEEPFTFGYMPNAGFPWARAKVAEHLSREQGVSLAGDDILLTCGAAGALNVLMHTVLEPGDEVAAIAPFFVEYGGYARNHGGTLTVIPSKPETFELDFDALEKGIGKKTRILIINSPNNPTGQIYSEAHVRELAALLARKSAENGRPIYLAADEPYRFLAFDGATVPALLPLYPYTVIINSFSKNLSLPGERIGYLALNPDLEGKEELMAGLVLSNRVLGFVNPPVLGQYIMAGALGSQVDFNIYAARRTAMAEVLRDAGYEFFMPRGAFYFFPKAPGGDDVAFVNRLLEERILAVPGSGFFGPGHFRLAFCVNEEVIRRAAPGLKRARDAFK
ncbi:pyridoxal phosphate-dependent aminotransferase [Desulfovibrio sp. OttesenSCG-928-I05]|nr:pyridoxal phosphate-dependent aminotransferase [Desulfovibrio sp. OttesenSCG-928-I05]